MAAGSAPPCASDDQPVHGLRHCAQAAVDRREVARLGQPVDLGERGRRRDQRAARDQAGQPGRVDPHQVGALAIRREHLLDHLLAARERDQPGLERGTASLDQRADRLGLGRAERVEQADARRRRRGCGLAARDDGEQDEEAAHGGDRIRTLTLTSTATATISP